MNPAASASTSAASSRSHSREPRRQRRSRPENVGILAMDMYFPSRYVSQADLEVANSISRGKYTIGLGQSEMAFCDDSEDINSVCMTAVQMLLEKYNIDPCSIGRLEVGTETLVDKSKSVKTHIMDLFAAAGNDTIEGVTVMNGCYGGTAALFNSVAWVESSAWDGRFALVVSADIAVYAEGPARPTGGCGAVAMLVGDDAPLVLEPTRSTFAANVYDFYKPNHENEYPAVDGHLSIGCYLGALDVCYKTYQRKAQTFSEPDLNDIDFCIFHSPYNKLVQKAYGRFCYNKLMDTPDAPEWTSSLSNWAGVDSATTTRDGALDATLRKMPLYKKGYAEFVQPTVGLPKTVGNTYTASVFLGILSLLSEAELGGAALLHKRVMVFSYGSGLVSSLYVLRGRESSRDTDSDTDSAHSLSSDTLSSTVSWSSSFSLQRMCQVANIAERLRQRVQCSPEEFSAALMRRELMFSSTNHTPAAPEVPLFPGTYYLEHIDEKHRRTYARCPPSKSECKVAPLPLPKAE